MNFQQAQQQAQAHQQQTQGGQPMQGTPSWMAQMNQNGVAAQMGGNNGMLPNQQQVLGMQHASAQLTNANANQNPNLGSPFNPNLSAAAVEQSHTPVPRSGPTPQQNQAQRHHARQYATQQPAPPQNSTGLPPDQQAAFAETVRRFMRTADGSRELDANELRTKILAFQTEVENQKLKLQQMKRIQPEQSEMLMRAQQSIQRREIMFHRIVQHLRATNHLQVDAQNMNGGMQPQGAM